MPQAEDGRKETLDNVRRSSNMSSEFFVEAVEAVAIEAMGKFTGWTYAADRPGLHVGEFVCRLDFRPRCRLSLRLAKGRGRDL